MSTVLTVLLIAFCLQGLVKFAVGFLVPYETRINRIASYYRRDGRVIGIYDSVTLVVMAVLVVLLLVTEMQYLSFVTGLVVGMLVIQIFFHRFSKPLPADRHRNLPHRSCSPPRRQPGPVVFRRPRSAEAAMVGGPPVGCAGTGRRHARYPLRGTHHLGERLPHVQRRRRRMVHRTSTNHGSPRSTWAATP
jgi:hypothetical protein